MVNCVLQFCGMRMDRDSRVKIGRRDSNRTEQCSGQVVTVCSSHIGQVPLSSDSVLFRALCQKFGNCVYPTFVACEFCKTCSRSLFPSIWCLYVMGN